MAEIGIDLYTLNKQVMSQLPPQPEKKLSKDFVAIGDWFKTFPIEERWFMLLCREKADYSLIHMKSNNSGKAVKELRKLLKERGKVVAIDITENKDAYEIWVKDINQEISVYMLFNSYLMLVEI